MQDFTDCSTGAKGDLAKQKIGYLNLKKKVYISCDL